MSVTETITSNARVLGADPLVSSGVGEEDMLTLVLPYIRSAREGVLRLGAILEAYGTYEANGVAFSDEHEIWWLETIGGHHWIARRVPDDAYVTNPNQFGLDHFEFNNPEEYLCSKDLKDFITKYHLDLTYSNEHFNPRYAFGSQRDKDRHYNIPRAWIMQQYFNPELLQDPRSFELPWCQRPYRKVTIEDVKYVLSNHYQDTPYDPYGPEGTPTSRNPLGRLVLTVRVRLLSYISVPTSLRKLLPFSGWPMVRCPLIQSFRYSHRSRLFRIILQILLKMFPQIISIGPIA